jgi:hypothetical protein
MGTAKPPRIVKLAPAKQRRLDQLLQKNAEGTISAKELEKLQSLVAEAEELTVANSQRLAEFARKQSSHVPATAIPVTVWINPELLER